MHVLTVAYLANQFPAASEPYVGDEIREVRARGVEVVPCTGRRTNTESLHILPISFGSLLRAIVFCIWSLPLLAELLRELVRGDETLSRRLRALAHTVLGAHYARLLRQYDVDHIHVHHGYFSSWIAMVAAKLLGISFSMTLHGSDLLVHHAFLGLKLRHCKFCLTVSEFNRRHILANYPEVPPDKVRVQRLGVEAINAALREEDRQNDSQLIMLSVGRLHRVKNHAFLLRACAQLKERGLWFLCLVAGDGPEHNYLERLARDLGLGGSVVFLGHVPHEKLDAYYSITDLVVLTSRSEGIPLVLMEAMAHGRIVLAPAITGIPELVLDRQTGFLYRPIDLNDFVEQVEAISRLRSDLSAIRRRARRHVLERFNRERNLAEFAESFPNLIRGSEISDANLVLQQI
jgi:glycosyltransferase involved in cell wall biosynthesis